MNLVRGLREIRPNDKVGRAAPGHISPISLERTRSDRDAVGIKHLAVGIHPRAGDRPRAAAAFAPGDQPIRAIGTDRSRYLNPGRAADWKPPAVQHLA